LQKFTTRLRFSRVPILTLIKGIFGLFFLLAVVVVVFRSLSVTDIGNALSNSLSISAILVLTALGLAITFGVMRVINMAHGDMVMLGAYTALVVTHQKYLHLNLFYAIPASFVVVALVGYLLEICLIRFLYGRPLDTLLATWGVGLLLQQSVQLYFGANLEAMHIPSVLAGRLEIGDVTIPHYRLFIVGITALCLLAVYLWFYKTSFGLKIRAVVQNRQMAAAMGISTRRVDSLTFAFASGLAGVAGCIVAHLYNASYNMGPDYLVDGFIVVTLGGMGQIFGSVAGGAVVGTGNGFLAKIINNLTGSGSSEILARVAILLLVVVFIMIRPSGLFAARERSYD
jgi:urea transport system permease protein